MLLKDDFAIVIDFLPRGYAVGRPEPLAQVIGDKYFTLLEVVAREGASLKHGDRIYIGGGEQKDIDRIKRRISIAELTTFARSEVPFIVERIVRANEARYVEFFNKCLPISTRVHQLELLPGIGKKLMWSILEERKKDPFKSFEDIRARVKLLRDPVSLIVKRVLKELENESERFRLFVAGPMRHF